MQAIGAWRRKRVQERPLKSRRFTFYLNFWCACSHIQRALMAAARARGDKLPRQKLPAAHVAPLVG